ncbi:MAG: cyclopropane-fatty-acyl-phospholipid synthase family protein, partial [Hyphomicrobiaceae bacterium]
MTTSNDASSNVGRPAQGGTTRSSQWRRRLLSRLPTSCHAGRLFIQLPSGEELRRTSANDGPSAGVTIHRWRALRRLFLSGHVGFAESYLDGDWDSPDLKALFTWAMANQTNLSSIWGGSVVSRLMARLRHHRNANSRRGSRRNIAAHYDLGNAFYAAWLDGDMNYSSGLYTPDVQTLEAAQEAKLDRIISLLDLKGGERILEIGCGWGALAERLAGRHGCHVTALTLSREQQAFAKQRIARRGLDERVDIRLEDYRAVSGEFDRIVSIEMIEAVGQRYWPTYFEVLRKRMKPGGIGVLQAITIDETIFPTYVDEPDFIQRYIFPGGMLPTRSILREQIAKAGLLLQTEDTFGASYVSTLEEWQARFTASWPHLRHQGFDERFRRMWLYY